MKELTTHEAMAKAANYCSKSEHCADDVRRKLKEWGVRPNNYEQIIEYLEEEGYIDHERFANAYALDKFRFNKWGKMKIRVNLRSKGIGSDVIESSLAKIDELEYLTVLKAIISSKYKTLKYSSGYDRDVKLMRFATQRGFESSIVSDAVEEVVRDLD